MSDPLQDGVTSPHISSLKFAKLHSPKMKSVYWRHFGFPTSEDDCIITKQSIVCTLCHKVLTNHGNTTNLRAHLQYRHKEMFDLLVQENGIRVPPRKPTSTKSPAKMKREPKKPKIKMEYSPPTLHSTISNESAGNDEHDEQSILYESVVPMTYDDDDVIDSNHFTKIEVSNANDIKATSCSDLLTVNNRNERKFCITTSSGSNIEHDFAIDEYQMLEALANLVVNDLRNVESLYDEGMTKFIRTLCGNVSVPALKKVETYIKEVHSDKQTTLADQIKVHSQIKPFSLGFEIWENVEQKHFLSIYFNYATEAPDYNLVNQIYCTIEYNKFTVIDTIFEDFNLNNCTAAIVNCDYDEYLKHFLNEKNIPVILSYDTIVNHCIKNVMELPGVASIIEEIKDTLMRYHLEISSKGVEIPQVCSDFPWTYYELLKFFSETLSWPEDVEALVASSKIVYDILSTLAVTMDTLTGEEIPLSSMLSPITSKVLSKRLLFNEGDDNFAATIKDTISTTLDKLILSDIHLTISALLDPRFHRLINISNYNACVQILTEKFDRIVDSQGISPSKPSPKPNCGVKTSPGHMSKKSNLELFFDLNESPVEQPTTHEPSNVETDLKRYRSDVYVTLDESPFLWWNRMSHMYSTLKHLAVQYQCLPCVVNMNYKKSIKQQIEEHQKRFMLTGNLIDAILFLHYN
ncbi:DNA replication-related element factor [Haematobia irritans]|uniref:DNA replication-related element factor n=1 Tax=Haematobia irritans TaxID=7368 RepID=UPI003F50C417